MILLRTAWHPACREAAGRGPRGMEVHKYKDSMATGLCLDLAARRGSLHDHNSAFRESRPDLKAPP